MIEISYLCPLSQSHVCVVDTDGFEVCSQLGQNNVCTCEVRKSATKTSTGTNATVSTSALSMSTINQDCLCGHSWKRLYQWTQIEECGKKAQPNFIDKFTHVW